MIEQLLQRLAAKGQLPQLSAEEADALAAGTVWIEGEFFSGKPDFQRILAHGYAPLPAEEQAFLDGPVQQLCEQIDSWAIHEQRAFPEELLTYMQQQGFFGLSIPKAYGGQGFSARGLFAVMAKVCAVNAYAGILVVLPNSLGPGELIAHYGSDDQKSRILPRLARGELIPCFGLTEPGAGSDAASIRAEAEVFAADDGAPQLRLNFRKRYITCAPIANLISLAVRLTDPDNLLGKGSTPGITVVLLDKGTPGLQIGDHHDPMGVVFPNGPIIGKDVVIPATQIIGGPTMAGQGWRMLMECLAGGRAISLPAQAIAGTRGLSTLLGAYSMVREQFGRPIGHMEGVREKVARAAALNYAMTAVSWFTCSAVDAGEAPPVASALVKFVTTEAMRQIACDSMDAFAGAGIMRGPNNVVNDAYRGAPVLITVEGANVLTRTLIIFGQGAVRAHPHARDVLEGLTRQDLKRVKRGLLRWSGHIAMNSLRLIGRGLTRGRLITAPVKGPMAVYYRRISWASTRFAWLADWLLLTQGASLKSRGKLSGRMADMLTWLTVATATLRRYQAEGARKDDAPLVHWSVQHALAQVQSAHEELLANLGPVFRHVLRPWVRLNSLGCLPNDELDIGAAACVQRHGDQWRRLAAGSYLPAESDRGAGRLLRAFRLLEESKPIRKQLRRAVAQGTLAAQADELALCAEAAKAGLISKAQAEQLQHALQAQRAAWEVDAFAPAVYRAQTTTAASTTQRSHAA